MPLNTLGLGFWFTATDMASGVMDTIKKNFVGLSEVAGQSVDGLDKMVRKLAGGLTTAAAGLGGLAGSFALAGQYGKFETAMKSIERVTFSDVATMGKMEAAAHSLGKEMATSPIEVLKGLKLLSTQGYDTAQMLELIPRVLKFATAGEVSVEEATTILGQALKGFGINATWAGVAMDQMQVAAKASAMDISDLRIGFSRLSSGVTITQGTLTDALTVFALAKNTLSSTQLAATSTSLVFERFADPKVINMMRKLGIQVLDTTGNFKNIPQLLVEVMEHMDQVGNAADQAAFLQKVFGRDGEKAAASFIGQIKKGFVDHMNKDKFVKGREAVESLYTYISSAYGDNDKAYEIFSHRYQFLLQRISATFESLTETLGKPFAKVWSRVVAAVADAIDKLDDVFSKMNPAVLEFGATVIIGSGALLTFLGVSWALSAALPLLTTALGLFGAVFTNLRFELLWIRSLATTALAPSNWKALATGLWGVAKAGAASALALWPWYLAAAAIAGITYAVVNNLGGLGDAWKKLSGLFVGYGEGIWGQIKAVGSYLGSLWDAAKNAFAGMMQNMSPLFGWVAGSITELVDTISKLASSMGIVTEEGGPAGLMITLAKLLGAAFAGVAGIVIGLVGAFAHLVRYFYLMATAVRNTVGPVFKWLGDVIGSVLKKLESWLETFSIFKGVFSQASSKVPTQAPVSSQTAAAAVTGAPAPSTTPAAAKAELSKPAAALAQLGVQEGWARKTADGGIPRVDIDYDKLAAKMAAANRNITTVLSVDGVKLSGVLRAAEANDRIRSGLAPDRQDTR